MHVNQPQDSLVYFTKSVLFRLHRLIDHIVQMVFSSSVPVACSRSRIGGGVCSAHGVPRSTPTKSGAVYASEQFFLCRFEPVVVGTALNRHGTSFARENRLDYPRGKSTAVVNGRDDRRVARGRVGAADEEKVGAVPHHACSVGTDTFFSPQVLNIHAATAHNGNGVVEAFPNVVARASNNNVCLHSGAVLQNKTVLLHMVNSLVRQLHPGVVERGHVDVVKHKPLAPNLVVGKQHAVVFFGRKLVHVAAAHGGVGPAHEPGHQAVASVQRVSDFGKRRKPQAHQHHAEPGERRQLVQVEDEGRDRRHDPVLGPENSRHLLHLQSVHQSRHNLRRRTPVSYNHNSLVLEVDAVVPYGRVHVHTFVVFKPWRSQLCRSNQAALAGENNFAGVFVPSARFKTGGIDLPVFVLLVINNLARHNAKLGVAVQIVLLHHSQNVLLHLVLRRPQSAPVVVELVKDRVPKRRNVRSTSRIRVGPPCSAPSHVFLEHDEIVQIKLLFAHESGAQAGKTGSNDGNGRLAGNHRLVIGFGNMGIGPQYPHGIFMLDTVLVRVRMRLACDVNCGHWKSCQKFGQKQKKVSFQVPTTAQYISFGFASACFAYEYSSM
ncbi:hypothetical protein CLUG_03372 [Clavispora lusitaniae ATCC 42720]|uniref:Uncharacterized protein n=1 Tax=Clavispora lusitaniae (strain ATCC 42720) TaxID=306902 RepID=C4Y5D8_CLAL4|nr:uncharacterized protein CLUG_03372 [Clavispora lusitaniae ATCC 42720]EEQ39244.1 hypothetical protein CLUG_03372 [Clavispora lusitaniae ATCC 42720]